MMIRRAHLLAFVLAFAGCECNEEKLIDARPRLVADPESLDFGDVLKNDLRVLGLELRNAGTGAALHITASALDSPTGEFALATPVPDALAAQQKVTINLVYQPTDLGEDLATITLTSDDGNPPVTVSLRGRGVEGGAGIELTGETCSGMEGSISFGELAPGMSAERQIKVTSNGTSPVNVLSAVVEPGSSPEWSIDASALPKSLAPGEELILTAKYSPVDGGADTGAFVITTDAPSTATIRIPACGSGVAPALCARPVPLDLGSAAAGQTISGTLTLESCGLLPLDLSAIQLANDAQHMTHASFRLTSVPSLPQTLSPGMTVDVEVSFDAQPPFGPANGFVQVDSNTMGMPQSFFPISARVATPCMLFTAPSDLYYRNVMTGATMTQSVLVGNSGESDCEVASLGISGANNTEFALGAMTPAAPFTLGAGANEILEVTYSPVTMGPHEAVLDIADAGGGTYPVALHGNPPELMGCVVEVQPTVVSFGVTAVGTTAHQGVRVVAIGDSACRVTGAQLVTGDPAFSVTLPLGRLAFPGVGGVTIDVGYAPLAAMPSSDVLRIDYQEFMGSATGTVLVGISGAAAEARICVMPPSLDFGTVAAGGSATQSVTITSCGAAELELRGAILVGGSNQPFRIQQGPTVPQTVASGAAATPALSVTYAPVDAGPHFGTIEILSSDPQTPALRVPLSGNWDGSCTQVLQCRPNAVDFGDTDVGTNKLVRVVCRNHGNAPVTVNSLNLAPMSPDLSLLASTPVTLQPGDPWTFDVRYAPASAVMVTASVTINSNACLAPPAIPVSGLGVDVTPPPCLPPSTFSPVEQWSWHGSSIEPASNQVWSTPLVANLNDDNMDGRIDENDVADIVFISFSGVNFTDPAASVPGVLRVLRGDNGQEEFSVTNPRFADTSLIAIGDLDGDGSPEIVGSKWVMTPPGTGAGGFFGRYVTGNLVALDHNGNLLWESDPWQWPAEVTWNSSAPAIADLDGDGFAEIVLGRDVFDHRGHLLWRGTGDYGNVAGGPNSLVADIDLDGHPEILAGGTAYHGDGTVMWDIASIREGGNAVAMLDPNDPFPQIAMFTGTSVTVLNHLGVEEWSWPIPSMGPATQLPTVADFDGDGDPDIAVADGEMVYVLAGTGGLLWNSPVMDMTCCVGISAFDFEGDGVYELILTDFGTVYVYRGTDGTLIYQAPRPSVTAYELPVVADIDNDTKAELVVALFDDLGTGGGIIAYSNVGDNWVGAPRIWNQQTYHVTNVYENGAIPRVETPVSQGPGVYRGTVPNCR